MCAFLFVLVHCLSSHQTFLPVRRNQTMSNSASFLFHITRMLESGEISADRLAFLRMYCWYQMLLCAEGISSLKSLIYLYNKLYILWQCNNPFLVAEISRASAHNVPQQQTTECTTGFINISYL